MAVILGNSGMKERVECGFINEEEVFERVTSLLSLGGVSFEAFHQIWGDMMSPNEGVDRVVRRIRPDVKKFVLSNTESIHWSYIEELSVMKEFFSDPALLIHSYDVGFRKPHEQIFLEGIRRSGLSAENILYVDDILEYTEMFKKLGGEVLTYNCSVNPLSVLEDSLASYGVLI